jgi:FlaA1/EpsC-like NDP-sugar epimerase
MTIDQATSLVLGRDSSFMKEDMDTTTPNLLETIRGTRILVIGAAGSIGGSFVSELIKFLPKAVHLVDISENNLAEVVRTLRSAGSQIPDDFQTYSIDYSAPEMFALLAAQKYDYVLNFSALKHVRSERDPYTLMRLLQVNVVGNDRLLDALEGQAGLKRVFSVSSDKSVRSANLMGASKAFMERVFLARADQISFTSARFANVAFSDGSLLCGFRHRLEKGQPLSAPSDIRRYFISHKEAGQLCLLSCFAGQNREILFPKFQPESDMVSFDEIARKFLKGEGYEPVECESDAEAVKKAAERKDSDNWWPCHFSKSDTSGEKAYEEFTDPGESVDNERFKRVGVVTSPLYHGREVLDKAIDDLKSLRTKGQWTKEELVRIVKDAVPEIDHVESDKNLDQKM